MCICRTALSARILIALYKLNSKLSVLYGRIFAVDNDINCFFGILGYPVLCLAVCSEKCGNFFGIVFKNLVGSIEEAAIFACKYFIC